MTPEQRARTDLMVEATATGLDWAECSAYADAMLDTTYGKHLVLAYAVADAKAEVRGALRSSWIGRLVRRAAR